MFFSVFETFTEAKICKLTMPFSLLIFGVFLKNQGLNLQTNCEKCLKMLDKKFCGVYNRSTKGEKAEQTVCKFCFRKMNTCRQNRREAVTQSQGTLLRTTCRLAETARMRVCVW